MPARVRSRLPLTAAAWWRRELVIDDQRLDLRRRIHAPDTIRVIAETCCSSGIEIVSIRQNYGGYVSGEETDAAAAH
jgi:hypothetical protein